MTTTEIQQLDEINFSFNWNNKLYCTAFTTLRLCNTKKYQVGKRYRINYKNKYQVVAECKAITVLSLDRLNEFIAMIDTGYSLEVCKKILVKMYTEPTLQQVGLQLILLRKIEKTEANDATIFPGLSTTS